MDMPKIKPVFFPILCILCLSSMASLSTVKSQISFSNVSINADGSIEPSTAPIEVMGDVYTFTANISGSVAVHRSNIVIDGAGYTLYGNGSTGIDLTNDSTKIPSPQNIWNVTIENLAMLGFHCGIDTCGGGNDTISNDYIVTSMNGSAAAISFWACSGNTVSYCSLIGETAVCMQLSSCDNTITENNIAGSVWLEIAGDETVDRNYWSDYLTKYPNATEIDSTGIGDKPYVFYSYSNSLSVQTQTPLYDYHPLINPLNIPLFPTSAAAVAATIPSSTPASASPSPALTPTPLLQTPTATTSAPSVSPSNNSKPLSLSVPEFWLAIILLLVAIFFVGTIVRHRKTAKLNR